jgi:1-acyl-sn-glycerol-3-phosphate acyltransferase
MSQTSNNHLDTMVLMSMYPFSRIHMIRPVAAADYFFRNKYLKWLSLNVIGIIPLDPSGTTSREALFTDCHHALDNGQTLLIFPEGSRGKPEELSKLRKGL